MPRREFFHLSPRSLKAYNKAYEIKRKIDDEKAYMQGLYNLRAFEVALSEFGAGLFGKSSHAEYLKKPFLQSLVVGESTNSESNEEIAVFEMKRRTKLLEKAGLPESPK